MLSGRSDSEHEHGGLITVYSFFKGKEFGKLKIRKSAYK